MGTYRIRVCTSSCPYCGEMVSQDYYGPEVWGPKFGRCVHCKEIFRTNKKLFSDLPLETQQNNKKEYVSSLVKMVMAFIAAIVVAIFTGWELLGVLAIFIFYFIVATYRDHSKMTCMTIDNYKYMEKRDPELYQLEYEESMRIERSFRRKEEEKMKTESALDGKDIALDKENNYCRKCGTKLSEDSLFCHKCGTKI